MCSSKVRELSESEALKKCVSQTSSAAGKMFWGIWRAALVMVLTGDPERKVNAYHVPVLSPIWNVGVFFHWLLSTYLRWTQELLQRREADWALLTHTLQYLEVILLWFYAPLSSRVLIFKSIFVFIFSHIKFAGLYSESLKVWSFESWVNEIFKNFFFNQAKHKA